MYILDTYTENSTRHLKMIKTLITVCLIFISNTQNSLLCTIISMESPIIYGFRRLISVQRKEPIDTN